MPTPHSSTRLVLCIMLATLSALPACVHPPKGPHGPARDAIEAARAIDHPSERGLLLERIAQRRDLSQTDQIYLVDVICVSGFSSNKADALTALVDNPVCTAQTRKHILKRLKTTRLLGHDESRVVEAIINKQDATTP